MYDHDFMNQTESYQSIWKKLSNIPAEYLPQVHDFLSQINTQPSTIANSREKILALASSWQDMDEKEFQDYLNHEGIGKWIV